MAQEAAAETGPLHEYVIASRLRRNRTFHRALLLARAALFILFLAYRVYTILKTCRNDVVSELESCRFNGGLGVVALVCEACFFVIFMLSIVMKWFIVERLTYPDKLRKRFGELPTVDVFVTTADPVKEPPLITMNTVLSVLTLDYPPNKLACYVSDDGGSLLTLWALKETFAFAKASWLPFCTKFSSHIQPRAPGPYFSRHINANKAAKYGFSNEWHAMKEKYQALETRISSMTIAYCRSRDETLKILWNELKGPSTSDCAQKVYSSWTLNYDPRNHASYCEILSNKSPHDISSDLPYLVYISREKHPQKKHNFKAGAMNTLLRVSGIMTNAPFVLNLDCDMYVNESNSLLQAMCIFMDKNGEDTNGNIGFVQFPQCFEGVDKDDIYGSSMAAMVEICLKGMDGGQGPIYCGTGCVHKRESLYGKSPYSTPQLIQQTCNGKMLADMFGRSSKFIFNAHNILAGINSGTHLWNKDGLIMESIDLMNSDYEEKTSWGEKVGMIYGSTTEDLLTGMKIHGRGWKSVFCMPYPPAFLGCVPSAIEDVLTTRKRWSTGMLEILFSSKSPLLVRSMKGLSHIQRCIYIYFFGLALTCFPLFTYLLLPAVSILGRQQILPKVVDPALLLPMSLALCMYLSNIYENKVVGIGLKQWWNSERMEYIVAISSTILALYEVLKKQLLGLSELTFTITPKDTLKPMNQNEYNIKENDNAHDSHQGFVVNSTLPIFVPPTIVVIFNIVALIATSVQVIRSPLPLSLWPTTEVACSMWILFMLHPFTKGFLLWFAGQSGPFVLSTSSVLHASLFVTALSFIALQL